MRNEPPETVSWLEEGAAPLHVIGQRMLAQTRREPACSYRWCVRDVLRGTVHDHNPQATCPASSTRKLFILLAVLVLIERGEWAFEDAIRVDNAEAGGQTCGGLWLLDRPRTFSVAELLKLMMALSDNVATFFLVRRLTLSRLNELSMSLGFKGTHHLSAVPTQVTDANHPLNAVNTTTASDLVSALSILANGSTTQGAPDQQVISRRSCEFALHCMRAQQDTTAIRSWLDDASHVGDKQGIGHRNYNNAGYLMHGGRVRMIFSIIVDDLHLIEQPVPAFAYARDFIATFTRMLDDHCRKAHHREVH